MVEIIHEGRAARIPGPYRTWLSPEGCLPFCLPGMLLILPSLEILIRHTVINLL
jgi:hypothetical protein